jgi:hypothetical protein
MEKYFVLMSVTELGKVMVHPACAGTVYCMLNKFL